MQANSATFVIAINPYQRKKVPIVGEIQASSATAPKPLSVQIDGDDEAAKFFATAINEAHHRKSMCHHLNRQVLCRHPVGG